MAEQLKPRTWNTAQLIKHYEGKIKWAKAYLYKHLEDGASQQASTTLLESKAILQKLTDIQKVGGSLTMFADAKDPRFTQRVNEKIEGHDIVYDCVKREPNEVNTRLRAGWVRKQVEAGL